MVSLYYFAFCAATALAIPVGPPAPELASRGTAAGYGEHGGFFYSFWTDGEGHVTYQNKADGTYSVDWTDCNNFYGGKGWNPGQIDRNITFSGTFDAKNNGYLSIYGTTRSPNVEYYVIEDYGTYDPTRQFAGGIQNGREGGTLEVDGASYKIGSTRHTFMVPVPGEAVLTKVYSVRSAGDRRTSGTVSMKAHFDAWRDKLGVKFGTMDLQIVATEGYHSSGEAEITVSKSG